MGGAVHQALAEEETAAKAATETARAILFILYTPRKSIRKRWMAEALVLLGPGRSSRPWGISILENSDLAIGLRTLFTLP
jgi:hypothetical protein